MSDEHNQPVADPIAYFESIPWCYRLMNDDSVMGVLVTDRAKLPDDEGCLMRDTLNKEKIIKSCISFYRYPPNAASQGEDIGEDPENPFLEIVMLMELGPGVNGFAKTVHGGFFGVLMDETMGNVANMQAMNGAYTAYLKVNFKKPVKTPQIVCLRGRVQKRVGKKLFLKGSMENSEGQTLAESEGLWIVMGKSVGLSTINESAKL